MLVAIGTTLGLCYLLSASGDVQTFVPPPESVAEQFLRAAHTHRYEIALTYLTDSARIALGKDDIQAFDQELRNRLGDYELFGGFSKIMGESQAIANVRVKGTRGEDWPVFLLTLERGLWKIAKILKPY